MSAEVVQGPRSSARAVLGEPSPNMALERTAGCRSLAAAAHRRRQAFLDFLRS